MRGGGGGHESERKRIGGEERVRERGRQTDREVERQGKIYRERRTSVRFREG